MDILWSPSISFDSFDSLKLFHLFVLYCSNTVLYWSAIFKSRESIEPYCTRWNKSFRNCLGSCSMPTCFWHLSKIFRLYLMFVLCSPEDIYGIYRLLPIPLSFRVFATYANIPESVRVNVYIGWWWAKFQCNWYCNRQYHSGNMIKSSFTIIVKSATWFFEK